MQSRFLRKRWLDFRLGHSIYLAFFMSFVNFILITYSFAIQRSTTLHNVFTSLGIFTIVFLAIYIPAAMGVGYWHRRRQYKVELEAGLQEDWMSAWLLRYHFRLVQGKATEEETKQVVTFYESILKRHNKALPPTPTTADSADPGADVRPSS